MNDKELIRKIKKLGKIQPSQKWLGLTRYNLIAELDSENQSFGMTGFFNWLLQAQSMALVTCLILIFLGGPWLAVKASQPSLPGDLLYSVKKINEGVQITVALERNKAKLQAEFAGSRLEELDKITEDSFSQEEKTDKSKQILNDFKSNLAGISQHVSNFSKEEAVAAAKTAKKLKQDLDNTKQDIPAEAGDNLIEAEKAIAEINYQILSVLTKDNEENTEKLATSTDEEILIWLGEIGTTTEGIIE